MTPTEKFTLEKLAASNFDCDGYKKKGSYACSRCRVAGCMVKYAPNGVCGYCIGRIRRMRAATAKGAANGIHSQPAGR